MIVVRAFFHKDNKYYPQVFLDECLYKLWMNNIKMLYYDRILIYDRIAVDVNKTSKSRDSNMRHYWYFLDKGFKFQPDACS